MWFKEKFKTKKQKLREECWNIDYSFVKWLNEHLKQYLIDASKIVDLDYHQIEYKGEKYTQRQLINKMVELTDWLKEEEFYYGAPEEVDHKAMELLDIFKITFYYLWW